MGVHGDWVEINGGEGDEGKGDDLPIFHCRTRFCPADCSALAAAWGYQQVRGCGQPVRIRGGVGDAPRGAGDAKYRSEGVHAPALVTGTDRMANRHSHMCHRCQAGPDNRGHRAVPGIPYTVHAIHSACHTRCMPYTVHAIHSACHACPQVGTTATALGVLPE